MRKHGDSLSRQPVRGYIENGSGTYTCQECYCEVRFTVLGLHDSWHRRLTAHIDGTPRATDGIDK